MANKEWSMNLIKRIARTNQRDPEWKERQSTYRLIEPPRFACSASGVDADRFLADSNSGFRLALSDESNVPKENAH